MSLQAEFHGPGFDYEPGSPHLRHDHLRARVAESLRQAVAAALDQTGTCRALELGAGHGTFTSVLRAAGATVVVTEMSPSSAEVLTQRFAGDPGVTVELDPDGDWLFRTGSTFDVAACISVLHHIPDYLATIVRITDRLRPGGSFVAWQDPMWYPAMPYGHRLLSAGSYFAWRLGRGDLKRGVATRLRRLRGHLDPANPADMAEYHVVRDGVDQRAIAAQLDERFASVELVTYWSTQSARLQSVGERFSLANTFGIEATDRRVLGTRRATWKHDADHVK